MTLRFDDSDIYSLLLEICAEFQVDPSSSPDSETFFTGLLSSYQGESDTQSIKVWLSEQVKLSFACLKRRPQWIQGFDWQFSQGLPMVFVGQIDIETDLEAQPQLFHDDTSFYVFMSLVDNTFKVIMQQY